MSVLSQQQDGQLGSLIRSTAPWIRHGVPYELHTSTDKDGPCESCGKESDPYHAHHDHFFDLVDGIASKQGITLDKNPETFPVSCVCPACNALCPVFKAKHKAAPSFFSLSPTDMTDFLAGRDVLEQVQNRYREPFRYWATRLNAWPEMRAAALTRHQPGSHRPPPKKERLIVLATLASDHELRAAFEAPDIYECYNIGDRYVSNGTWTREVMHNFAHHIWWTRHGTPKGAGDFVDAFKLGNMKPARRLFALEF